MPTEINNDDVWYHHAERCAKAGEEYDSEFPWLTSKDSGTGDDSEGTRRHHKAVPQIRFTVCHRSSAASISKGQAYLQSIKFIPTTGGGYAPDVAGCIRDIGDGLVGPGVSEDQNGKD